VTENPLLQTIVAFGLLLRQSAFKGMCSEELMRELAGRLQNSEEELELKTAIASFLK
jgi:hypothetical protein